MAQPAAGAAARPDADAAGGLEQLGTDSRRDSTGFTVSLTNFDGPFDLLLGLIAKREMDVTAVALAAVTDEFIGYVRGLSHHQALDESSNFILIAATLLDLKAAQLLPGGEVESQEDVAALEARDLLFARLLQYRASNTSPDTSPSRSRRTRTASRASPGPTPSWPSCSRNWSSRPPRRT
ncbi:ScpA family protein [Nesterenkonia sp. AN1]|uniref:segregation and condensation protein A n=1 Tax=Nesterenkonia sp. AN1 TaxID=652017 RepID=UPI0004AE913F|nr:ScpA family protein [Nesterenkonia sp. AN1]